MTIEGRSPTMRHVTRNHRVALVWLFDRINLEPKIQIKYIDTKNQVADILTKGNFTRDEWNHFLRLFNNMSFSMFSCSHFSDFFPTIRFESRASCQKRVRRRLRTKALRWRKRDHAWWRAIRGVRKSLHKVLDFWSIQGMPIKRKVERASRKLVRPDSRSEVGYSQASRQEKVPIVSRKLAREDQLKTE